jgi:hypothetical protein
MQFPVLLIWYFTDFYFHTYIQPRESTVTAGPGFDDWVYLHFLTITINYYSSQSILPAKASTLLLVLQHHLHPYDWLTPASESESLYDWRYTANQVLLAPSPLRLTARISFLNWTPAVIVLIKHPLWQEDESVIYSWCWPSPAHSFSGPSPVGLATIFYCLRFGTSPFVASYDSQGYGGGIRHRLHTGNLTPANQLRVPL